MVQQAIQTKYSDIFNNKNSVLIFIILIALSLRLYGINFEIPHPDDYITVQGAMHFGLAKVELTGYGLYGLYVWPAFSLVQLQIVLFSLYFMFGWAVGFFPDLASFKNLYQTDPSSFYLIGRYMCVGFGVGTVGLLYYLSKKIYNYKIGLLAALFLSVSFLHSFHSQFIRPDVPATFFIMCTITCGLLILKRRETKYYIYAGIFAGLAIATKFTCGILVGLIFVSHILAEQRALFSEQHTKKRRIVTISIILSGAVLLLLFSLLNFKYDILVNLAAEFSPDGRLNEETIIFLKTASKRSVAIGIFVSLIGITSALINSAGNFFINLINSKKIIFSMTTVAAVFAVSDPLFFFDIKEQIQILTSDPNFTGKNVLFVGVDSLGFWGNLAWYTKGPLSWGAGHVIAVLSFAGLFIRLSKIMDRENIIVLFFPAVYLLVVCLGNFKWERYMVSLMPFVALYAALFLYIFCTQITLKWIDFKYNNIFLTLIAVAIVIQPIYNILRYDYLLTQIDTRTMAKKWVEQNIRPGSKIGQDAYTGNISVSKFKILKEFTLSSSPLEFYIENGFDYLMVSDTQYNRYFAEPEKYQKNNVFYNSLFNIGHLIKEFEPSKHHWPTPEKRFSQYHIHISPTIRIYKIDSKQDV